MIEITQTLAIDEADLQIDFVAAAGPGGQNVNKVATQAQLRFKTGGLPEAVRERLGRLAGRRMTAEGEVIIQARRYRTQEQNRQEAIERLVALLRAAATPPKPRRKTRPTLASKLRRREAKERRSAVKRGRRGAWGGEG